MLNHIAYGTVVSIGQQDCWLLVSGNERCTLPTAMIKEADLKVGDRFRLLIEKLPEVNALIGEHHP